MRNALILGLLFVTLQAGATVYYVRPTNGDNGNAGTSFAAAWQTTQYAIDNTTDGDEIRLCAEATETPTATIDIDQTYDDAANPIYITGANGTDGSVDGTVYTISGSSLGAGDDLIAAGAAADYVKFQYIRFTAGKDDNISIGAAVGVWTFSHCRIDTAADDGVYTDQSAMKDCAFIDCEVDSNTGNGSGISSTSGRGFGRWIRCSVHDNGGNGIEDAEAPTSIVNCIIYDNAGIGVVLGEGTNHPSTFIGNTVFGNGSHGVSIASGGPILIYNNVFRTNGGYGIYTTGGAAYVYSNYNCVNNNTSGTIDSGSLGANSITSDPKFTSETDGSEDFTPQAGSPLLGAGIDGGQW